MSNKKYQGREWKELPENPVLPDNDTTPAIFLRPAIEAEAVTV